MNKLNLLETGLKIIFYRSISSIIKLLHRVPRIVALVCTPYYTCTPYRTCTSMPVFTPKLLFNVRALIFSKFPQVKNQVYQKIMQKNIVSIFLTMKDTILDTHDCDVNLQKRKDSFFEPLWHRSLVPIKSFSLTVFKF